MKRQIFLLLIISLLYSCQKNDQVKVEYIATGSISEYTLYYLDAGGTLATAEVKPESARDEWRYSHPGQQGDMVYVSGRYADPNSGLNLMIKLDGKIYKQGFSQADTVKFLTVSGVVPYRDK